MEFAKDAETTEVIFSSTPLLGYQGEDKITPAIFKWDGKIIGDKEENINKEELYGFIDRYYKFMKCFDINYLGSLTMYYLRNTVYDTYFIENIENQKLYSYCIYIPFILYLYCIYIMLYLSYFNFIL